MTITGHGLRVAPKRPDPPQISAADILANEQASRDRRAEVARIEEAARVANEKTLNPKPPPEIEVLQRLAFIEELCHALTDRVRALEERKVQ